MHSYNLVTIWHLPAPLPRVWQILSRTWDWPQWWPYVERVEILEAGDAQGLGARHRHCWKTCLPYRLCFVLQVVAVQPHAWVDARVSGDLLGTGRCQLRQQGDSTLVRYDWHVHTSRAWMNRLAPIARPIFIWNHQRVMAAGERACRRILSAANKERGSGSVRH